MQEFTSPDKLAPLISQLAALARDAGVQAYVVGGSVRDRLLGRELRDLDLAVDRDALGWSRRLAGALGGHFVELDGQMAIARVVLDEGPVSYIDVAQLQGTLQEDLRRRDFTVDAMAAPLGAREVIDPLGGRADMAARLIRMNGPDVFEADPLRLLRGVRIAAELGFEIEPATAAAIRERASKVVRAAAERRRDELARIFALEAAYPALRLLDELGLLDALLPEVTHGKGITQPGEFHAYDVFEHGMRAVEAMDLMLARSRPEGERAWMWDEVWESFAWCEAQLRTELAAEMSEGRPQAALLKLATLLHDVAKPQTRERDAGGRVRFFGHADLGAEIAGRVMRRLRFSAREVRFVKLLVAEHLRPVQLAAVGEAPSRRALYRFYRDVGAAAPALLFLALADAAAARGGALTRRGWRAQVRYMASLLVRSVEEEGIVHAPRLLTGRDLMSALGIPEGPMIGRLLDALAEAQAAGEVDDREGALALARELARRESSPEAAR